MSNRLWQSVLAVAVVMPAWFGSTVAVAADLTVTGFGTIGYARSDQDFQYLRYIDNSGTLKADSLVGLQGEAQFSPQWGATVQLVASAPRTRDDGYEAKIRWAFLSFRPDNDWLFRVGRLRPPFSIHSQNAEVGVTYDQARLPQEVYSSSPVYDFDGGAVIKTWSLEDSEFSLDAYWGKADIKFRLPFQRDPSTSPMLSTGQYLPERLTAMGLVLSRTSGPLLLRAGVHQFKVRDEQPIPERFVPTVVPAPPPFGGTLYVPLGIIDLQHVTALTLSADWRSGLWHVTAEYLQRIINDIHYGPDSKSGYVTVARSFGKWTPYVTHARLLSGSEERKLYQELNATPVPLAVQGPPFFLPANLHRVIADQVYIVDQYSTMLGASYSFSATSKLKFEWMRTKVGLASALVNGDVHNQHFNVYSISYSISF